MKERHLPGIARTDRCRSTSRFDGPKRSGQPQTQRFGRSRPGGRSAGPGDPGRRQRCPLRTHRRLARGEIPSGWRAEPDGEPAGGGGGQRRLPAQGARGTADLPQRHPPGGASGGLRGVGGGRFRRAFGHLPHDPRSAGGRSPVLPASGPPDAGSAWLGTGDGASSQGHREPEPGHPAADRPGRKRQEHDLGRDSPSYRQHASRQEHRLARGPGRDSHRRGHAGADHAARPDDLSHRAAVAAAPGPPGAHDRRDSRRRDRPDRHRSRPDRSPAHEHDAQRDPGRCAAQTPGDGHRALSSHLKHLSRRQSEAGPPALREVQETGGQPIRSGRLRRVSGHGLQRPRPDCGDGSIR